MTEGADKVREFYRLGQQVLSAAPIMPQGYHPGVVAEFVTTGVSKPALYKARRFAELYSAQDIERICKHQLPDGRRLGIGHIYELIQIADSKKRRLLEQRTVDEGWSSRRLRTERRLAVGGQRQRPNAGRKPRLAGNQAALLHQLQERTDQWLRWSASVLAAEDEPPATSSAKKFDGGRLPPRLPRSIRIELRYAHTALGRFKSTLETFQAQRQG
jgi:hypothetical protein